MALGTPFGVNSTKETETGYERTSTVDGRMVDEEWNSQTRRGSYTVVLANRFTIAAVGTAPGAAQFKALAGAIDADGLVALAKN